MPTTTRGQELERRAQACLEARGCLVERARNIVRWLPDKTKPGTTRPVSLHHDFFGRWDGVYVTNNGIIRGFYQVTTEENFHARRNKVLAVGGIAGLLPFPATPDDLILAHRRGTRIFRVACGPLFLLPQAVDWLAPKKAPSNSVRRRIAVQEGSRSAHS